MSRRMMNDKFLCSTFEKGGMDFLIRESDEIYIWDQPWMESGFGMLSFVVEGVNRVLPGGR